MKSNKSIITLFTAIVLLGIVFTACSKKEGCTNPKATNYDIEAEKDDGSCILKEEKEHENHDHAHITFNFTHNFDGTAVTDADFDQFNYVNANGDTLSISKLRYLISDVRFYKSNGDSVVIEGYNLVDVTNGTGLSYATTFDVPHDSYTGVAFNFGFDSLDNAGSYADLNSASWNWPGMLGGGYHYMQMEGKYKHLGNDSIYAYHNGTARVSTGVFEQNHFIANLADVTLSGENVAMEIKMNIAEWYKNPNTWDLNALHAPLMPIYNAQKMMQANGATVFSLGTVTQ